jgi:hypothetical protein
MKRMSATPGAILFLFQARLIVPAILLTGVIAFLALSASQGNNISDCFFCHVG